MATKAFGITIGGKSKPSQVVSPYPEGMISALSKLFEQEEKYLIEKCTNIKEISVNNQTPTYRCDILTTGGLDYRIRFSYNKNTKKIVDFIKEVDGKIELQKRQEVEKQKILNQYPYEYSIIECSNICKIEKEFYTIIEMLREIHSPELPKRIIEKIQVIKKEQIIDLILEKNSIHSEIVLVLPKELPENLKKAMVDFSKGEIKTARLSKNLIL